MPARKFTNDQEQEIARRYAEGESLTQLGKAYDVAPNTIGRLLKRHGVAARSNSEANGGIPVTQHAAVVKRYLEGENTYQLGKAYGVSDGTISKLLKSQGVAARSRLEARGGIPVSQHADVVRRYLEGKSTIQLGKAYGVAAPTIRQLLKRQGVTTRSNSEALGGIPVSHHADVVKRYLEGESTLQLGKAYGVSNVTISNLLKRQGIAARSISEARGGIPVTQHSEVVERYLEGENTAQLGKAFGIAPTTIRSILKSEGVAMRSLSEVQGGIPVTHHADVVKRYLEGENTYQLGKAYGVSNGTISRVLERAGIERRSDGGGGDSVQHAIDGTGRHSQPRECEFYLFELARYSDTHCKPGIAFDTDSRAGLGKGEYGAEVLRLVFATRAEAYFLEQAVLDATRGAADCPADFDGWIGASEVRAMPAEDMVPIIERLVDELEELGLWEFAAAYVPMTAAQRVTCQQRAHTLTAT